MTEVRAGDPERLGFIHQHVRMDAAALRAFCERWQVVELMLFGSVVRDDFGPESDVDVMVRFAPESKASLWDFVTMQDELAALFGRPVDLMERVPIANPFKRRTIERDLTVIYEAG